jgi:hypothetical protein
MQQLVKTMGNKPGSGAKKKKAPPARSLTDYFSPSPSRSQNRSPVIDLENDEKGGTESNLPRAILGEGTSTSPLQLDGASNHLETVVALQRISRVSEKPDRLTVRAGDADVYVLFKDQVIGRSLAPTPQSTPRSLRNNKIDLGICGASSGVSRKHLVVKKVDPLVIQQVNLVTNRIKICRYNQLTRTMSEKMDILGAGDKVTLKHGDVVVMDGFKLDKEKYEHIFRVVKCVTPKLREKKRPFTAVAVSGQTVDLVRSSSVAHATDSSKRQKTDRLSVDTEKTLEMPEDTNTSPTDTTSSSTTSSESPVSKGSTPDKGMAFRTSPLHKQPKELISDKKPSASPTTIIEPAAVPAGYEKDNITQDSHMQVEVEELLKPEASVHNSSHLSSAALSPPKVGDPVRVEFESIDQFFQRKMERSWWFGTVHSASNKSATSGGHKIEIKFRDNSVQDYVWPDKDVQRLESSDGSRFYAWVPTASGIERELAFDNKPETLAIGDLVDALYHNGSEDGKWFRGRIARICSKTNSCTIAYEDAEVETGTPIGEDKIILVEKGTDNTSWLVNMGCNDDYNLKSNSKKKAAAPTKRIGSVTKIEERGGRITLTLSFVNGEETQADYESFATYIFESNISRHAKLSKWPEKCKRANAKKKVSKRSHVEFREEEWDITEKPVEEKKTESLAIKETHLSLANSFFRALNTAEPLVGYDLLCYMVSQHGRGMNPTLGRNFRELFVNGPKCDDTPFPDTHRLEAAMSYVDILLKHPDGDKNFHLCSSPESWSNLQHMLQTILEPWYTQAGDDSSLDDEACSRVADSLHQKAMLAEFLNKLFRVELSEHLRSKKVDKEKCRSGRLVKALWDNPNGVRSSIKDVAKTFAGAWVRYGHFVLCDFAPFKSDVSSSRASVHRCRSVSRQLLMSLGNLMSSVLWLYSTCDGVRLKDKDLAYIIEQGFNSEASNSKFDSAAFMTTKAVPASYKKHAKLHLVFSLDEGLVEEVQANLAQKLGVINEYKSIVN